MRLFPQSAGAAIYVERAFNRPALTQLVAVGIILTGVTSAATMACGFSGYIQVLLTFNTSLLIGCFVVVLTLIACWGIKQSAILITAITLLEMLGLIYVLFLTANHPAQAPLINSFKPANFDAIIAISLGSFIAFYAFIGFEDMVNIVEEAKNPTRALPKAILVAVGISLFFYVSVALMVIRVMPVDQLAQSNAPLADLVKSIGQSPLVITFISLISIINCALVQMIMASRVFYGMAKENLFPAYFAHINAHTQTPIRATLLTMWLILALALFLPLVSLAKITSAIMLVIFIMVNSALITIKLSTDHSTTSQLPLIWPILGATSCFLLLTLQIL